MSLEQKIREIVYKEIGGLAHIYPHIAWDNMTANIGITIASYLMSTVPEEDEQTDHFELCGCIRCAKNSYRQELLKRWEEK